MKIKSIDMVLNRKIDKKYDNLAIYCQIGKHVHTHVYS